MNETYISQIISKLCNTYLFIILIAIESIVLLIILLKKWENNRIHLSFTIYTILIVYLFTFGSDANLSSLYSDNYRLKKIILECGNTIFSLAEATTFYLFFKRIIENIKLLKIINILFILFLLFFFYSIFIYFLFEEDYVFITKKSIAINEFEFLILLIFCLIYYYNLIDKNKIKTPINIYQLVIVTPLFFYVSIAIPFISFATEIKSISYWTFKSMIILHYASILFILSSVLCVLKKQKSLIQ